MIFKKTVNGLVNGFIVNGWKGLSAHTGVHLDGYGNAESPAVGGDG